MYNIELVFNKELDAYPNEARLYKSKQNYNKNMTVDSMIIKSLDSAFKIIDSNLCKNSEKELNYLFDLIKKKSNVGFEIINLDSRGLYVTFTKAYNKLSNNQHRLNEEFNTIGDYIEACKKYNLYTDKTRKINLNLFNIALVFKLDEQIHWNLNGLNTIVVFCDLDIRNDTQLNSNNIFAQLVIKRVELLELHNSLSNSKKINITFSSNSRIDMDPEFYNDLCQTSPKVLFKNDSKLRKYLRYDDWTRFVYAIRAYYWDKNSEFNHTDQILYYLDKNKTFDINDDVNCYLWQLKNKPQIGNSKKSKYFLINRDDENDKYQIKIQSIEKSKQLISCLEKEVNDLNNKNDELTKKIKNNDSKIENYICKKSDINKKLKEDKDQLEEINKKILDYEQEQYKHEVELKNLKSRKEEIDKNSKSTNYHEEIQNIKIEIEKIKENLKKFNDQIESLKPSFNNQEEIVNKANEDIVYINNKINEIKEDTKNISHEKQLNDVNIKKYDDQINFIKQDKYNIYKIKFYFEEEQKQVFNPLELVNSVLSDDFKTANNFYIDEKDTGTLAILNRYADGLDQIKFGYYKNPYLFYKLIEPEKLIVENIKEVDSKLIKNYQLNNNQELAVKKGINIDNFFYLQGPPGTGKTQTICAIANSYALENKTILMTSQSHEAINNFFDRLDELNNDNPLLVMIKYISNQEQNESNKYNMDCAWKRFVNKCINACDPLDENNFFIQVIDELEAKNFIMPTFITKKEKEIIVNNTKLVDQLNSMNRFSNNKNLDMIIQNKDNNDDLGATIDYVSTRYSKDYKEVALLEKYDNLINELNKQKKLTKLFDNLSEIKKYLTKDKNANNYASLFRKKYLDKDEKLKNSVKFKNYIVKNKLINIFGITTTSTITLTLLKKNDTDLFYDWPIDIVIIDEISKSNTPEILSRIVLAKKVIFAGDYKQLPPESDFSIDECKYLIENDNFNKKFNKTNDKGSTSELKEDVYDSDFDPSNEENIKEQSKRLYDWLESLYKDSFFKKEVETLKNQRNKNNTPYQNLTVSHRFCSDIMNVVNTFYDYDEKLELPTPQKNFSKYKLNLLVQNGMSKSLEDPVILIDTSILSSAILEDFKNSFHIKTNTNDSFDTRSWKNKNNKDISYNSAVNPYNALIINNVISNLLKQNPKLKVSDIGVITMTKSQKSLITQFLNKEHRGIKIDTVDNFQGREAEIIILDFVRSYGKLNNNSIELKPRNLDFYFVNERINVAISRAKSKLIIVGSFKKHYYENNTISNLANITDQQNYLKKVCNAINESCILNGEDYKWLEN